MTTKNNLVVSSVDFDQIKANLKEYMKSNSGLTDVDFEGSVAAVFLDTLAYNTFYNAVYLNAATNESYLSTATQRSNVVSRAAEIGYVPRSMTAARVTATITVTPTDTPTAQYLTLPAKTIFTTKIGNTTYKFQNLTNTLLLLTDGVYVGTAELVEGSYYIYRYTVDTTDVDQKFFIPSTDIDLDFVTVGVIRDLAYTQYSYTNSIVGATSTSKVFWLKENDDGYYEVIFGDGTFGESVVNNDIVVLEYYICNGAIPNGATSFTTQTSVGGYSNVVVTVADAAYGGGAAEDIESVRDLAPRVFEAQNRAVTWSDYEALLKDEFSWIESVKVWGGEDNDPPYYGRVFVSAKPTDGEYTTSSEQTEMSEYIRSKNISSIIPMFVQPDYIYLKISSVVKFLFERSPYTIEEVPDLVQTAILNFIDTNLEQFGASFEYSNLTTLIDGSVSGIKSNITTVNLMKKLTPSLGTNTQYALNFKAALEPTSISSTGFKSNLSSETIYLESSTTLDSSNEYPVTYYYIQNNVKRSVSTKIGSINYNTGKIQLNYITIASVSNSDGTIDVQVTPLSNDYEPTQNVMLTARSTDITVTATAEISK